MGRPFSNAKSTLSTGNRLVYSKYRGPNKQSNNTRQQARSKCRLISLLEPPEPQGIGHSLQCGTVPASNSSQQRLRQSTFATSTGQPSSKITAGSRGAGPTAMDPWSRLTCWGDH